MLLMQFEELERFVLDTRVCFPFFSFLLEKGS